MAAARDVHVTLDSAGTGDWHVGKPPYGPMQEAALARGYDLSTLRARQVSVADFEAFDLIIAMDGQNVQDLRRLQHGQGGAASRLFTDFAPQTGADHVPDPYFTRDFEGALDLIEEAAQGLLDQLS